MSDPTERRLPPGDIEETPETSPIPVAPTGAEHQAVPEVALKPDPSAESTVSTADSPVNGDKALPVEPRESDDTTTAASSDHAGVNGINGTSPTDANTDQAPETPAKTVIALQPETIDISASPPPPPPPKPELPKTSTVSQGDTGAHDARPEVVRTDTQGTMQEVDLNGGSTPGITSPATSEQPLPPSPSRTPQSQAQALPQSQTQSSSPSPSPAAQPLSPRNAASASVTSLHSQTSTSVPSPSRPGSARPMPPHMSHSRRSSVATTLSLSSVAGAFAAPQLSTVLITPPLQVLVDSKEAKKSASFRAAAQKALELCQDTSNAAYMHPREIFEPLRLAISNPQTTSVPTLVTSLDLLSKLISHSFFNEPEGPPKGLSPLSDLITHTITLAYSESSPPQVALQVVKALMAVVLSTTKGMLVHQSSLLKAVRTVYNVFLLSNDAGNQVVAQGALTQMVHHVFGRVIRPDPRPSRRTPSLAENEARRVGLGMGMESERGTPTPSKSGRETPGLQGEKMTL